MTEHEGSEEGGEGLAGLMRATWIAYVATGADTDGDQQWHCSPEWAGRALMHAVETLRKDYDDSLDESTAAEAARDTALREKADLEARLAEVEALADEWSRRENRTGAPYATAFVNGYHAAAEDLRAALANPSAAQREAEVGARAKCWRGECRTSCYYPDTCTEAEVPR